MHTPPGSSAGRRFLRRSGFALASAALFGALFGLVVYFRVPRAEWEEEGADLSLQLRVRSWLEQLELRTYDWRARELGRHSQPPRDVTVVALDDETLAAASEAKDPGLAMQPWPREVVGGLVRELSDQGAKLVLLDFLYPSLSPRACSASVGAAYGPDGKALDDDLRFRALLDTAPGKSILAFSGEREERKLIVQSLIKELALVDQVDSREATWELLRKVLATRRPAFSVPDGQKLQVWAGVESVEDARQLLDSLGAKGSEPVLRPRTEVETAYQVSPAELAVSLAEVEVAGIDPEDLPMLRALVHPNAALIGTRSGYGGVIPRPDVDGAVRGIQHLYAYRTKDRVHVLPSMPLAAAMELAGTRKLSWRDGRLQIGEAYSIPMDRTGYSLVRWDAPDSDGARGSLAGALSAWSVVRVMGERAEGRPTRPLREVSGKVVVFTDASSRGGKFERTPIGEATPQGAVLGQALANVLRSDGIVRLPAKYDLLASLVMALVGALLALSFSGALRSTTGAVLYVTNLLVVGFAYAYVGWYLFVFHQQWLAIVGPLLALGTTFVATTVHALRTERDVKQFIFSVLGRSVSPEVARKVARDFDLIRPERRPVTVCFADLEGFTRISEKLEPEKLIELLRDYFEEMTRWVRHTGGHLDKFIGDEVMAIWNAPGPNPRHASLACESALRMRDALLARQPEWEEQYGVKVVARAGLNTGEAVVGHVGSQVQAAYSAIGETVNLAARLEGLNKTFGTFILVGEETEDRAKDDFVFREVDRLRVPGRSGPVRIYELMARRSDSADSLGVLPEYERALEAWHRRDFQAASDLFSRCASEHNDPVSAVYVARCRKLLATPPGADWDGIYEPP